MTGEVEIRLITGADLAVLKDTDPDVFDHPVQPAFAARFLASPDNVLVVAMQSGLVVGMASGTIYTHPDKPLQLFINEMGVADRVQGQGIGKRLIDYLLKHAAGLGCVEAWVATEEDNTQARGFYRSAGGQEQPERAVVYTWRLEAGEN
jgi:aminoglycoside 6'-N-acetyltransferase I